MANALSRHPLDRDSKSNMDGEVKAYVNTIVASKPIKSPKLEEIHRATPSDTELQKVMTFIRKVWPQRMPEFSPREHFMQPELNFPKQMALCCTKIALSSLQHSDMTS